MKRVVFVIVSLLLLVTASGRTQAPMEPVAKDVAVYSFKIHYVEAGRGAPVILLHGTGGEGARWMPTIKGLMNDFHVFAIDQIGFGQSDKPLTNYHTGVMAQFLAGFMKAVGVPKASIIGQSMGGAVAIYFGVHYPQMLERLVVVDGGGFRSANAAPPAPPDVRRQQIANAGTLEEDREYLKILYYDDSRVTDEVVEKDMILRLKSAFAITKLGESGQKGLGSVSEEEVRGIKAPTLIIWGKQDEQSNPAGADRLNAAIAGSRKVLIDKAGHYPFLEHPDEFNRIVREFLKGTT